MKPYPTPENEEVDVRLLEKRVNILYHTIDDILKRLSEVEEKLKIEHIPY